MQRVLAFGFAALSALGAGAAEVSRLPNGNVELNARGVPLGLLLQQFGSLTRLDTTLVDRRAEAASVSVAAGDVPLDVALQAVLQAAGVSFVLWGDDPGSLRLLVLGEIGAPAPAKGAATAPAPPALPELPPDMDPAVAAAIQAGVSPDDPDLAMIGTGAPERSAAPEDDPDLAEILGPPAGKPEEGARKP